MSCYTGMKAALYVQAETGDVPVVLTGDLFDEVSDVTLNTSASLADVSTRANSGWRSQCPTLKDLSIDITAIYKGTNAQLDVLRAAYLAGTLVDATILTSATGDYEGPVGRFAVTQLTLEQPLEEGQRFNITLTLNEFGAWITGTHASA